MQTYTDNVFATDHAVQTDMQNVENNFAALKSAFSGATTPANTVAGMWWFDTTTNILKLRNEANNAWQSVWDFANNKPVITNLSNEITVAMMAAAIKDPAAGTAGLRTLGTGAAQALPGNTATLPPTNNSVTQAKLKTSQGSVSVSGHNTTTTVLPGGEYGFRERSRLAFPGQVGGQSTGTNSGRAVFANRSKAAQVGAYDSGYTSIVVIHSTTGTYRTSVFYLQQRYVTSSGEVFWVFILRDKTTKDVISMYQAPDHPCFGNGGKPLLVSHPFGSYDSETQEIIVINPTNEEIETMELETIVDDETKPDKDLLEIITEKYEIDENSKPAWPTKPVTVGLPKHIKDKKGKKILADYRFMGKDDVVEPVKKVIPKPDYIKVKRLRKK